MHTNSTRRFDVDGIDHLHRYMIYCICDLLYMITIQCPVLPLKTGIKPTKVSGLAFTLRVLSSGVLRIFRNEGYPCEGS